MKQAIFLILVITVFLTGNVSVAQDTKPIDGSIPVDAATPTPTADMTSGSATVPVETTRPSPASTGVQTPVVSSTPAVSFTPTVSAVVTPAVSNSPVPSSAVQSEGSDTEEGSFNILYTAIVSLGLLIGGFIGFTAYKSKIKENKDKCRSIRDLLEQKKKELEDMLRNLPKDKAKELVQGVALDQLRKDEHSKELLEKASALKKKYDNLKGTIEMLEKRYNLCTLELPSGESPTYKGTIVKNSLRDADVLKSLKVEREYADEDWNLNDVMVSEKQIEKLGSYLNDGPWYMNFWKEGDEEMIIVFKEKSFKIKRSDKVTWKDALEYGKSKGIPEEQLDFAGTT